MGDQRIGAERLDRRIGIAEGHGDAGDAGVLSRKDVIDAIADHDGTLRIATGHRDRIDEVTRVGLAHRESIATGNGLEVRCKVQLFNQRDGKALQLVGADGEPVAGIRKPRECLDQARKALLSPGILAP